MRANCLVTWPCRKNTDEGSMKAAQSLAQLGISLNPELAFTGNLLLNSVKPLLNLLKSNYELQQFEGLMALTNFAAVSEQARDFIIQEDGIKKIASLQLEENFMLQRASTEALVNMLQSPRCYSMFAEKDGEMVKKLRFWLLFAGSDDVPTSSAASGGLAMLTESKFVCEQMLREKNLVPILKDLVLSEDSGLRLRGVFIVRNFLLCGENVAENILDHGALEMLTVVEQHSTEASIKELCNECMQILMKYGLIKKA